MGSGRAVAEVWDQEKVEAWAPAEEGTRAEEIVMMGAEARAVEAVAAAIRTEFIEPGR